MAVQAGVEQMGLGVPSVVAADDGATRGGLTYPGRTVMDAIWLMIVTSFVIVLVGSFLALAALLLIKDKPDVQTLVTVFTTTVGFLAGLITPTPGSSHSGGSGKS